MRVVICDDEKSVREKYSEKLESLKSKSDLPIEIETYDSGEKLLFDIEDRPADIVYMDIGMPGIDGIAAAKEIRKINSNCELFFLTARTENWDVAFDLEASNYLINVSRVLCEKIINFVKLPLYILLTNHDYSYHDSRSPLKTPNR